MEWNVIQWKELEDLLLKCISKLFGLILTRHKYPLKKENHVNHLP